MNKNKMTGTKSTPIQRRELLLESLAATGIDGKEFGIIMNNGVLDGHRILAKKIAEPDKPSFKGTTYVDITASQLIRFLKEEGYDVKKIDYDPLGRIKGIPKT
jgi:hypothetical protein